MEGIDWESGFYEFYFFLIHEFYCEFYFEIEYFNFD